MARPWPRSSRERRRSRSSRVARSPEVRRDHRARVAETCGQHRGRPRARRAVDARGAADQGARIVCFPEAYLARTARAGFRVCARWDDATQNRVWRTWAHWRVPVASQSSSAWSGITPEGSQIASVVIDDSGRVFGWQSKNQLDPSEDQFYVPGRTRRVFDIEGLRFGIVTCHEGWRYPETVRWAAVRGASVVFHPQHAEAIGTGPFRPSGEVRAAPIMKRPCCAAAGRTRSISRA